MVWANSTEGASAFTGSVGASGVEVITVSARGSKEAVARALVEAGAAMVMFACSWSGRPGVDASGDVTRTVKSPARGSGEPRVVVRTVLVESGKAAGSAPSEVTTVLPWNTCVFSNATSVVDVASAGIEAGSSVQVVVAVKGLARKSSEVGAAVAGTATPVGVTVGKVARVDVKVRSTDAVVESGTWVDTWVTEETSAGREAGTMVEVIVLAQTGKVPARGTGPPSVGAATPTVVMAAGTKRGAVVRRERLVAFGTVVVTAGAGLGFVGASVTRDGRVGTEAWPFC